MIKRLWPKSLIGQAALLMAGTLLVAQAINFGLILSERQRAVFIEATVPAVARFAEIARDVAQGGEAARDTLARSHSRWGRRIEIGGDSEVTRLGLERDAELEGRVRRALARAEVEALGVEASSRVVRGPVRIEFGPPRPPRDGPAPGQDILQPPRQPPPPPVEVPRREIHLSAELATGRWLNARFVAPRADPDVVWRIVAATAVLYGLVLGAALFIAQRLARPWRDLAAAAADVGQGRAPPKLAVRGPLDVRQALSAFNDMSRRVSDLLREKDLMLGAIGHDLRTPLASLRIRIESMEPAEERARAIETIEETTRMLTDIVELSRQGKSGEAARAVDLAALVDSVVEEFREMGMDAQCEEAQRTPITARPALLKRAVRNLVENAIVYAGAALVRLDSREGFVEIVVEDQGPGVPPAALDQLAEPFYRVEGSRSRETGGAGLGLALVKAIAVAHGGSLSFENRAEGGFRARVRLPRA